MLLLINAIYFRISYLEFNVILKNPDESYTVCVNLCIQFIAG